MELKDEDIKKALECCVNGQCEDCPFYTRCFKHESVATIALELINRQQAEVEQFKSLCTSKDVIINEQEAEIERLNGNLFTISNACMQRRNEAIKEFAERLKAKVDPNWDNSVDVEDIDRLLAEMAGGENA